MKRSLVNVPAQRKRPSQKLAAYLQNLRQKPVRSFG